jgi:hypothetical protein
MSPHDVKRQPRIIDDANRIRDFFNSVSVIKKYGYYDACRFPVADTLLIKYAGSGVFQFTDTAHNQILDDNSNSWNVHPRKPGTDRYGRTYHPRGFMLYIVAPNRTAIELLAHLDLRPSYLENATDLILANWDDSETMNEIFAACFIHDWHGKHRNQRYDNGGMITGQSRPGHRFTGYGDRLQKLINERYCFHFEDRNHGLPACREKLGIEHARDMLDDMLFLKIAHRNIQFMDNLYFTHKDKFGRVLWNRENSRNRRRPLMGRTTWSRNELADLDAYHGRMAFRIYGSCTQGVIDEIGRGGWIEKIELSDHLKQTMHTGITFPTMDFDTSCLC